MIFSLYKQKNNRSGIISLTTVVIIGSIIMETGLISLAVAYLVGEQGFGVRMSYNATYAAKSGINDAFMRILRDKDVNLATPYVLQVGSYSASISATRSTIENTPYAKYTITSTGSAVSKRATLEGTVVLNNATGVISSMTYEEIP